MSKDPNLIDLIELVEPTVAFVRRHCLHFTCKHRLPC